MHRKLFHPVLLAFLGVCFFLNTTAHAGIVFNFNFDPQYSQDEKTAIISAGQAFSNMFGKHFTNSGTVNMDVEYETDPNSYTLAYAGSYDYGDGLVILKELTSGVNTNGNDADGVLGVNFAYSWYTGSGTTPNNEYDFYAAIFHEFTHALGFSSSFSFDGSGDPSQYDWFLKDAYGDWLVDNAGNIDLNVWDNAKESTLYFVGANAVAANGGNPVILYTPSQWEDGSSVSHLDKAYYPDAMMKHDRGEGPEARDYNAIEVGILTDLGYSRTTAPSPVPEPATLSLFAAGLCGVWLIKRRKAC